MKLLNFVLLCLLSLTIMLLVTACGTTVPIPGINPEGSFETAVAATAEAEATAVVVTAEAVAAESTAAAEAAATADAIAAAEVATAEAFATADAISLAATETATAEAAAVEATSTAEAAAVEATAAAEALAESTIADIAMGDENFSTLVTALESVGLAGVLQGEGPFTVFAPTNAAFEALPEDTLDHLMSDPTALIQVLLYHMVSETLTTSDLQTLESVVSTQSEPIAITVDGDTVMVNEVALTTEIVATNGVIHVIDAIILPPSMRDTE